MSSQGATHRAVPRWMPDVAEGLSFRSWHDLLHQDERYCGIFERGNGELDCLRPDDVVPTFDERTHMEPWIIEAPFSSVEILENILKPSKPLQIYTARHIHQHPVTSNKYPPQLKEDKRFYREYVRFQGRLEQDREISFVCLSLKDRRTIYETLFQSVCWSVRLFYISIPWCNGTYQWLQHPWAIVLRLRPPFMPGLTYENRLERFLNQRGMPDCKFERSLLKPGTTPLPECVLDWIEGIPGTTGALPYYIKDEDTKHDGDIKEEDTKNDGDIKKEEDTKHRGDIKKEEHPEDDGGIEKEEDTNDDYIKGEDIISGDAKDKGDIKVQGDIKGEDVKIEDSREDEVITQDINEGVEGDSRQNEPIKDERMKKRRRVV